VLNAHGTQNIFLLFVDEKIYKERKLSPKWDLRRRRTDIPVMVNC
jgi:hypothetical protein